MKNQKLMPFFWLDNFLQNAMIETNFYFQLNLIKIAIFIHLSTNIEKKNSQKSAIITNLNTKWYFSRIPFPSKFHHFLPHTQKTDAISAVIFQLRITIFMAFFTQRLKVEGNSPPPLFRSKKKPWYFFFLLIWLVLIIHSTRYTHDISWISLFAGEKCVIYNNKHMKKKTQFSPTHNIDIVMSYLFFTYIPIFCKPYTICGSQGQFATLHISTCWRWWEKYTQLISNPALFYFNIKKKKEKKT